MGDSSGSLIFAVPTGRTSSHNSMMMMKQNANSSIHVHEHGKVVWFVIDDAPDSSNINPAFDRGLIHKPRVIPHAALNETQTEREHSRRNICSFGHFTLSLSNPSRHNAYVLRRPVQRQHLFDTSSDHAVSNSLSNVNPRKQTGS